MFKEVNFVSVTGMKKNHMRFVLMIRPKNVGGNNNLFL